MPERQNIRTGINIGVLNDEYTVFACIVDKNGNVLSGGHTVNLKYAETKEQFVKSFTGPLSTILWDEAHENRNEAYVNA